MSDRVLCPNCGRRMAIDRTLPRTKGEDEMTVFKCEWCNINFITEDHLPVSGMAAPH